MPPVKVEVITYAPTVFAHCQHCELTFGHAGLGESMRRDQVRESLPDDLRAEYAAVSAWVHDLRDRFGDRLRFRIVDVASVEGVWKSFRHRLRRYPAVVVQGERRYVGARDLDEARHVIERYITAPTN
ncbi:MAG TPA: DUF1525 domain-containing protein [Actinomycetota bacterium]|nr:DUF1525 domain-containing protein [Actinomycetota bacterium]